MRKATWRPTPTSSAQHSWQTALLCRWGEWFSAPRVLRGDPLRPSPPKPPPRPPGRSPTYVAAEGQLSSSSSWGSNGALWEWWSCSVRLSSTKEEDHHHDISLSSPSPSAAAAAAEFHHHQQHDCRRHEHQHLNLHVHPNHYQHCAAVPPSLCQLMSTFALCFLRFLLFVLSFLRQPC